MTLQAAAMLLAGVGEPACPRGEQLGALDHAHGALPTDLPS